VFGSAAAADLALLETADLGVLDGGGTALLACPRSAGPASVEPRESSDPSDFDGVVFESHVLAPVVSFRTSFLDVLEASTPPSFSSSPSHFRGASCRGRPRVLDIPAPATPGVTPP